MSRIVTGLAAAALAALATLPARAEVSATCSGIGEEERAAAESIPHTLKLVYARPDGHYLGNVETRVTGPGGETLVETRCPGPWLLVDLPKGTYQISATFKGETKTARVSIGGGRQQQVFTF